MDKTTLIFHEDGGHGWLAVPLDDVKYSGADISVYSYMDDNFAYLEEDCDVMAFIDAIGGKEVFDQYYDVVSRYDGCSSPIRNMDSYRD